MIVFLIWIHIFPSEHPISLYWLLLLQVQVWAIGSRQELAPPPGSGTRHATTHRGAFARRALTYVLFKVGHGRGGHSRFPPFQRWSQPGASSLDETPDLPLPAGDPLAAQGSKPRRSPLRHVEADHLAGGSCC